MRLSHDQKEDPEFFPFPFNEQGSIFELVSRCCFVVVAENNTSLTIVLDSPWSSMQGHALQEPGVETFKRRHFQELFQPTPAASESRNRKETREQGPITDDDDWGRLGQPNRESPRFNLYIRTKLS